MDKTLALILCCALSGCATFPDTPEGHIAQRRAYESMQRSMDSLHNSLNSMADSRAAMAKSEGETAEWMGCHNSDRCYRN